MVFEKTVLGIEFGSTRIKAMMLDEHHLPVASGSYEWENRLIDGIWTYSMTDIHTGLQACYADLKRDVKEKFGTVPTAFGAIGVSAMMHGYLPFDSSGQQLAEFRTWRNTITGQAAEELTALFGFNIPQRWSIAHLWQAILNGEEHTKQIAFLTTLAGYIHTRLTGEKKMGLGEASGMFPIDSAAQDYNSVMMQKFDALAAAKGMPWKLRDILPEPVPAGTPAGNLTAEGALFLDPEGDLRPGIPFAPCEGDAGTGMVATNSVRARTGNVSAGTSDFAMLVADHELGVHKEICMVTTPTGLPVAMVHCTNCTSDINAWVSLFSEFADLIGADVEKGTLFTKLFLKALEGDPDCGGLLSYNYFSGEGVTGVDEGRPVFARLPDSSFTLANFMRTHLLSALATLKIGMDILTAEENIPIDRLYGHGGFFKTPGVGQRLLSAAVGAPVSLMETAGEGGPYGMALLCAYMLWKKNGQTLEDYLDEVFADASSSTLMADEIEIAGFDAFLARYKKAFDVEKAAIRTLS
ncbi:MAG: ATPase [Oscillospiraceae bacterium]|nr:ATPase [Oscillospiraceae bacterium]